MTKEDLKFLIEEHAEKLLKKVADPLIENAELQAIAQKLVALCIELDHTE